MMVRKIILILISLTLLSSEATIRAKPDRSQAMNAMRPPSGLTDALSPEGAEVFFSEIRQLTDIVQYLGHEQATPVEMDWALKTDRTQPPTRSEAREYSQEAVEMILFEMTKAYDEIVKKHNTPSPIFLIPDDAGFMDEQNLQELPVSSLSESLAWLIVGWFQGDYRYSGPDALRPTNITVETHGDREYYLGTQGLTELTFEAFLLFSHLAQQSVIRLNVFGVDRDSENNKDLSDFDVNLFYGDAEKFMAIYPVKRNHTHVLVSASKTS